MAQEQRQEYIDTLIAKLEQAIKNQKPPAEVEKLAKELDKSDKQPRTPAKPTHPKV